MCGALDREGMCTKAVGPSRSPNRVQRRSRAMGRGPPTYTAQPEPRPVPSPSRVYAACMPRACRVYAVCGALERKGMCTEAVGPSRSPYRRLGSRVHKRLLRFGPTVRRGVENGRHEPARCARVAHQPVGANCSTRWAGTGLRRGTARSHPTLESPSTRRCSTRDSCRPPETPSEAPTAAQ